MIRSCNAYRIWNRWSSLSVVSNAWCRWSTAASVSRLVIWMASSMPGSPHHPDIGFLFPLQGQDPRIVSLTAVGREGSVSKVPLGYRRRQAPRTRRSLANAVAGARRERRTKDRGRPRRPPPRPQRETARRPYNERTDPLEPRSAARQAGLVGGRSRYVTDREESSGLAEARERRRWCSGSVSVPRRNLNAPRGHFRRRFHFGNLL